MLSPLVDESRKADNVAHRSDAVISKVDHAGLVVQRPATVGVLNTLAQQRVSSVFSDLGYLVRQSIQFHLTTRRQPESEKQKR